MLAGPARVFHLRADPALVHRLEAVIDTSGLGAWFEAELAGADTRAGGRRRTLNARALLVALLTLSAAEQPLILRDAARLLNAMTPSTKHRLGIPRTGVTGEGAVTERMVSYLFNRMLALIDPSPHAASNRDAYERARDDAVAAHADPDGVIDETALGAALTELKAGHADALADRFTRLRWVLDRGVEATHPRQIAHTGSYALDSSEVRTWARQNRKQPKAPWLYPDPDASWNGKKTHGSNGWYGYWLHALVRVPEASRAATNASTGNGDDVPCLVERIDLTAANADVREAGLGMLTRMVADHENADAAAGTPDRPRRDVLADRAYTSENRKAEDWIWPLWELGFTSVHDLTVHQLGPARRGTPKPTSGALVIDGQPYSPRLPAHLRTLTPPPIGADRATIAAYQASIAQRAIYALHAVGGRNEDGSWDFGCRAMALLGQLRCDLKPRSLTLPLTKPTTTPTVFTPPAGRTPKVCGQEKSRISRDELPYWQPDLYGSKAWYDSFNRRNRIEGIFGNLKNDATQNITRGNFRVMGLAKTAFMTMVAVMAVNLRLLDAWQLRRDAQARAGAGDELTRPAPRARRPRRRTLLIEATRARVAAARAAADAVAAHQPAPGGGAGAVPDPPPDA
ncbi:hypothetical protein TAE01_00930 [Terrabacter aerolatus]|uniref:Transposase DDE domain-containing protein n=1 Tax=Terrabacter aerolatus TaxID=422442 RepID=A0A512CVP9_9MICO|nr:hypothetical protein TAE01_00930 [Terrabacter aerolatus]